jgi:hypothetical protein
MLRWQNLRHVTVILPARFMIYPDPDISGNDSDQSGGAANPFIYLRRHPVAVEAFFRHSLVLTYAFPQELLLPLLPPGLTLDTHEGCGFVAIAMVQTESLRPTCFPRALGRDFFLAGYRIFARFRTASGRNLRGLRILRSDTDRRLMAFVGNRLTHYNYHHAKVDLNMRGNLLEIQIQTPCADADLHVIAELNDPDAGLPAGSPFASVRQARLFAGPLPYTFDYEPQTHSIIRIEGVRRDWKPRPVTVEVRHNSFFEQAPFNQVKPILANAFQVENIQYQWRRGICEALSITH